MTIETQMTNTECVGTGLVLFLGEQAWMGRRVEICRAANDRYFEALGVVGEPSPTRHLIDPVSRRIVRAGRPYRALRPIDPREARLFSVVRVVKRA